MSSYVVCNLNYIYNKHVSTFKKPDYEKEFMTRRQIAVHSLNGNYNEWNEEYRKNNPNPDFYSQDYTDFIADKQDVIFKDINAIRIGGENPNVILKTSRDECGDIVGYILDKDATIQMVLKNVKEI